MKKLINSLVLCLLFSCSGKQKETAPTLDKEINRELPVLNLSEVIDKDIPDTLTWNSIAKKTVLIPLSTSQSTLVGVSPEVVAVTDDYIFMAENQTNTIFRITKNGKIVNRFRHVGNGPGEYIYCSYVTFSSKDSLIHLYDNNNLKQISYDQSGKFVKEISLKEKQINLPVYIDNEKIIVSGTIESPFEYMIYDHDLNLIKQLCPRDTTLSPWERSAIHLQKSRCNNVDTHIVNYSWSDSVFTLTADTLQPLFILRKGEYALPEEETSKFIELMRKPNGDPHILRLHIHSLPAHYLIQYIRNNQSVMELWGKKSNEIISRFFVKKEQPGIPFVLPTGKKVYPSLWTIYIDGNTVCLFIPAEEAAGEIPGVKEDDNPVLLLMEL